MRPVVRDVIGGAVLGALVLGLGGRIAMREVASWEGRARIVTLTGTLTVVAWGAMFGFLAGLLRTAVDRVLPGVRAQARKLVFAVACVGIALVLLTPWTVQRIVLFVPVVAVFVAAFERWRTGATQEGDRVNAPQLRFGFRGENITYRDPQGREMEITFTHMNGARIPLDSMSAWTDGSPLTDEEKGVALAHVLPFAKRHFEKSVVVINTDDPSRALWERLCTEHRPLIERVEHTSDQEQLELQRSAFRGMLATGRVLVDDVEVTSEEELDRFLEARRKRR